MKGDLLEANPVQSADDQLVPVLRSTAKRRQWGMTLLANLSILSAGMALGFPAVSLPPLTSPTSPTQLNTGQASWFASINTITCPVGGLLAGFILDRIGRKMTMVIINVLSIISWSLQAWTDDKDTDKMYYQLLLARLLIGIAGGLSSSPVSVYAAEISHPKLRGRLTVMASVSIGFGVLIIYFFGFLIQDDWRLNSKIALGISIIALIASLTIPESPQWLARKRRIAEAEVSYRKLNGHGRNDSEVTTIDKEATALIEHCQKPPRNVSDAKETIFEKLQRPNVYKPLGLLIGFFTIQQLCGIFVVIVYIGHLAQHVGVTVNVFTFTVVTGSVRFLALLFSTFGSDKLGRRKLALASALGVAMSTFAIAVCLWYPTEKSHWYAGAFLLLFVFMGTIGLLTVPFAMIAELYPADVRGFCAGLNVCYAYTLAFVLIKSYPFVTAALGVKFVLVFISIASLLGSAFLYRFLPETKGKTMKEIQALFT